MGTGYTRQDTSNNIANGNVINADDLDAEFNAVETAFDSSSGHTHDGTSAEGAPIEVTGPNQEYVSGASAFYPKTDDTYDLGGVGAEWKNLYVDGTANIDTLAADAGTVGGSTITTTDNTQNLTNKTVDSASNTITVDLSEATVTGTLAEFNAAVSDADLVSLSGTETLTNKTLTSPDINGGSADNLVIGATTPASATFSSIAVTGTVDGRDVAADGSKLDGIDSDIQTQVDSKVNLTSSTGSAILPAGTTAERDASPAAGYLRFNADENSFEGYDGAEWGAIGGAAGAELVATGSIPGAGTPVVLRSDGTVEVAGGVPVAEDVGSPTVFESSSAYDISAVYDSAAGKVVIAYGDFDNSNYGTAVVGTVSGSSISFGSPTVFESADTRDTSATYDSAAGKVVIAYRDNGNSDYGTAVVGTVSGDSISFGSPTVFEPAYTDYISATYDSAAGKVVIAYRDTGNSSYGTAIVGTVSGSSISFGSPTVFKSFETRDISSVYDSAAGKVVIAYRDNLNSNRGTAIVGTVSGSSISFGSPTVFEVADTYDTSATYDSADGKVVIAYRDNENSNYGTAVVGTVSGDSISFGSPTVFESAYAGDISAVYDSVAGKVVIAYRDDGNSDYGTAVVGTVSGDSISFGSPTVFESAYTSEISATYDSVAGKVVIAYRDGTAITYSPAYTGTNANDFVGFAQDSASDSDTVLVATNQQIDANQTGLTPKSTYYVDADGTLTTSDTGLPVAGFALDANTIRTGG